MNGNARAGLVLVLLFGCAVAVFAGDQLPPLPADTDTSPYHLALLAYKGGRYDDALKDINDAETAKPGDVPIEILKARILTERHDFTAGAALLQKLIASGGGGFEAETTLGALDLYQHDFRDAVKVYNQCLAQKPNNPEIILDLIYSLLGAGDYVTAGKYFSQLKPFDPDYPCYYFAKAALAQATGKAPEIDEDIETVRTIYGITVANRYFKTYIEVFSPAPKDVSSTTPAEPPSTNAPAAAPEKSP